MNRILYFLLILFLGLNAHAAIHYVKTTGTGSGASWNDASNDLQDVINMSATGDTIFVAAGIYTPVRPIYDIAGNIDSFNRNNAFYFDKDLVVLGGFPDANGPGLQNRDGVANPTILSGDLGNNQIPDNGNAYHVILTTGSVSHDFLLDGFKITGGQAENGYGGGWYNTGGSPSVSNITISSNSALGGGGWYNTGGSPSVSHITISSNWASTGAGWYNANGSPLVSHTTISNNSAGSVGGGCYNENGSPLVSNTTISNNSALDGGGWFNYTGNPSVQYSSISNNSAVFGGGGWSNLNGSPSLTHVDISGNSARDGGGWQNSYGSPSVTRTNISGNRSARGGGWFNSGGSPVISNTIISGNTSSNNGGGLRNSGGNPTLTNTTICGNSANRGGGVYNGLNSSAMTLSNSIIYGNTAQGGVGIYDSDSSLAIISYSLVQDYTTTTSGNIAGDTDPLFIDLQPATTDSPTTAGNYRLQPCSPLIDRGNNSIVSPATTDLDSNTRIWNAANAGVADLGAYEFQGNPRVLYVDSAIASPGSGATWATALNSLADAIQFAQDHSCVDSILVAKGTYYPAFMPPDASENRDKTFYINRGNLVILGGYATGGSSSRNWTANPCILSGDIDRNDTLDDFNAYHVIMTGNSTDTSFLLDGFTVTGGKSVYNGGGWYNAGSPSVSHVIIRDNLAGANGGGWYNDDGHPILSHTAISNNRAGQLGGGWYNWNGSPSLNQTDLTGNSAYFGGGWYNADGDPSVVNATISGNIAWGDGHEDRHVLGGGGWYNHAGNPSVSHTTISGNTASGWRSSGGGWHNDSGDPSISHTIISGNSAEFGGGWCNFLGNPSVSQTLISGNSADQGGGWANLGDVPLLNHITISGNTASWGGGWYNDAGDPSIVNSIISGNTAPADPGIRIFSGLLSIAFSLIQDYTDTADNNITGDSDPGFIDPQPSTPGNPTTAGNYRLKSCSLLIDKGDNSQVTPGVTDLDDNDRIWNAANGGIADLGAYELQDERLWIDTVNLHASICRGGYFIFAGNTYDTSVQESHHILGKFQTAAGCDSMVRFTLEVKDTFIRSVSLTVCESELPFTFGSQSLSASGSYTEVFSSYRSCDSTVTLSLQVNDTFITDESVTISYSQLPYSFGTQLLTQPGTYTTTFPTIHNCDSTVTLHLEVRYNLSGTVHNDVNGMSNNTINGPGTNAGGLKVVLVHADTVMAWNNVTPGGQFSFVDVPGRSYRLILTAGNITGNTPPPAALPAGWVNTGEKKESGNGHDGQADGTLEAGVVTANLTNIRFGIQQPPVAQNSSVAQQLNPGSNATVNMGGSAFQVTDPSPGMVKRLHFIAFPAGADRISINNNGYTPASWPAQGVEVNAVYLLGNLLSPSISIDPASGDIDVLLMYRGKDEAGFYSAPATITLPFRGISIGGIVHNNTEGLNGVPVNSITGTGTNGGGLYALLSDDISNLVVASAAVSSTGAYAFTGVDKGYYTVRLSTGAVTPGNTAVAASLPSGWLPTGEKNGAGTGTDGFANATIYLGLQEVNNSQVRFGIQQPPVAFTTDQVTALNPGGSNLVTIDNAFSSQDALPGRVTALYFNGSLPQGVERLLLNGTAYSATNPLPPAGIKVSTDPSGMPLQNIQLDPQDGSSAIVLNYKAVDASGMMSNAATATIRIQAVTISGRAYNDLSNSPANTIDGPGTNAGGTLKAVLINNATHKVAARKNIAADGSFSFGDIAAGSYRVLITMTSTGQNAPAVILPTGWILTSEYLGNGAGSDGNADGILELGSLAADVTDIRFGIKQAVASGTVQNTASGTAGRDNGVDTGRQTVSEETEDRKDDLLPDAKKLFRVYPNPATERVYITSQSAVKVRSVRLLDINGREMRILRNNISEGMDMSGIAAGNYLIQAVLEDGSSRMFKVAKE